MEWHKFPEKLQNGDKQVKDHGEIEKKKIEKTVCNERAECK